ncbi:helix-turn-helix domain-containing protein [Rossellomorea sp. NPDC077527]|uniref:helix-turn-helix domain-containing protein n=1 Tax=Rossellomorea sp. NPDC077527 TaxID=3364510 RepID=UPI0037CC69E6
MKNKTRNTLPEVLTAKHIADYLGISRRRVYELFQMSKEAGGIPNFDIGNSKRVEKDDLVIWIQERKSEKEAAFV